MHFFPELNNRNRGKRLTVTSVLFLALASAVPVLQAQEWDHINGRDKLHDPTGAWLVQSSLGLPNPKLPGAFLVIVFNHGGTVRNISKEKARLIHPPLRTLHRSSI
jgi:hypothetical protein